MHVHHMMSKAGISPCVYRWLPDSDIVAAWEQFVDAPEMVQLLCAVGVPNVADAVRCMVTSSDWLAELVEYELRWNTWQSVYNAVAIVCRHVPEELVCSAIRVAFPLASFAERLAVLL
jgi:hypothetical protein